MKIYCPCCGQVVDYSEAVDQGIRTFLDLWKDIAILHNISEGHRQAVDSKER